MIQELNDSNRKILQEYLEKERIPNAYLLSGLQNPTDNAKFHISFDGAQIRGTLMVRRGQRRHFSWLLAETDDVAKDFSKMIQPFPGGLWTTPRVGGILREKSNERTERWRIESQIVFDIMHLDISRLKLDITYPWRELTTSDAYEWSKANLLMDSEESGELAQPEPFRMPTTEELERSRTFLTGGKAFGIFDEQNRLAARSAIEKLDHVGVAIRRVFTNSSHRNRGYARSIASVAVQEAAKINPANVFLFVRDQNSGAKRVYEKIGFKSAGKRIESEIVAR